MLLVYSDKITPRFKYITNLVFGDILGLDFHLTGDQERYNGYPAAKINYSLKDLEGGIPLRPSGLLSETGIREQKLKITSWEGNPVFYHSGSDGVIPFDFLSVAFFLVTRYEEYLTNDPDAHGRFKHTSSLAFREGFLEVPLINVLAGKILSIIKQDYPDLEIPERRYRFIPTVDVDMAFAHLGRGFFRTAGSAVKLLISLNINKLIEKFNVLSGSGKDPFDNFDFQFNIFEQHDLQPLCFILLGDYGAYNKNSSHKNRRFRKLLSSLSETAELGIHPSYHSMDNRDLIREEIARLRSIIGNEVNSSRQHFLRFSLPETFRYLVSNGIKKDYSMGYASHIGFRASICSPFRLYDLKREEELPLEMYPFAFMDTTLRDYMNIKPDDYLKFVNPLIGITRSVGGILTGIWHNYAISDDEGERKAFMDIVNTASHD